MRTKPTILCIDDHAAAVAVRKIVLEQAGYQVLIADSGEQGLEMIRHRHVDLVLLDHFLKGRTGAEISREIKLVHCGLPIILLSGAFERPPDSEYADAFLNKLEGREALLRLIEHFLQTYSMAA